MTAAKIMAMVGETLVPQDQARVSPLDRGNLYGDGVFETVAVYGGRIFRLERHLDRFYASAESLKIRAPFARGEIAARLQRCLDANSMDEGLLRFSLSRGTSTHGLDPRQCRDPLFLVLAFPPKLYPDALRRSGARLSVSEVRRIPSACLAPSAKSGNYLNNIMAYASALEAGAQEAILLNTDGCIAEGATSNLFFVVENAIHTPGLTAGIIPGITREAVLETCRKQGIPAIEGDLPVSILERAEEAFYTNTSAVIMPVGAIGSRELPSRRPVTMRLWEGSSGDPMAPTGSRELPSRRPVTMRLWESLLELVEREAGPCWARRSV